MYSCEYVYNIKLFASKRRAGSKFKLSISPEIRNVIYKERRRCTQYYADAATARFWMLCETRW